MRCNSPTRWNFDPALMINRELGTGKVDRSQRQKIKHNISSVLTLWAIHYIGTEIHGV